MNDIVYVGKHLRTYAVQSHYHDNWEFVYCTSGGGTFEFEDNTTVHYSAGDVVVVPPRIYHANNSVKGFMNIHIRVSDAMLPFKSVVTIHDDSDKHVLRAFEDLFFYFNSSLDKRQLLLSAFSNLIINYVIAFQNNSPLSKVVEEIKSNIVKNFPDSNYELDSYLRTLPFSYDYLRKLFKSEIGITPHAFLTNMRLQTAEKLLSSMDHEYNVTKVALMVGYDEPLYFSRVFKKQYGCSPLNYANRKHKSSGEVTVTKVTPPRLIGE